jgi:hypothetical protein
MRWFAGIISFLALVIVLLPNLGAQDNKDAAKADAKKDAVDKKDPEKKDDEKKDAAKKDDDKKDEKKDEKKKDEDKAKKKKEEEKVVYGQTITAKLKRLDANSARDFAIEVPQVDPMKVNQLNLWKMNEMARIMAGAPPRSPQAVAQRQQQMARFQAQLMQKQNTEIYTMKDMDLRAVENCKVRAMSPPVEFDDKGRMKTYTQKELNALKAGSKLPGYPADFDRLNVGQIVTVYLAKPASPAKGEPGEKAKKKNLDDDDLPARPEVVMIVVMQEATVQQR